MFATLTIVADTPPIVTVKSEEASIGKCYPVIKSSDPPKLKMFVELRELMIGKKLKFETDVLRAIPNPF